MIQGKRTVQVKSTGNGKVAIIILTLTGVLFCCFAIGIAIRNIGFLAHATHTFGRVVDLDETVDDDGNSSFHPIFAFVDQHGQEHGTRSNSGSNPASYDVGDTIPVVYRTDAPDDARIDTFWHLWGVAFVFAMLGGILTAIMTLVLVTKARRAKAVRQGFGQA